MLTTLLHRLQGRSPEWAAVERAFLILNPRCAACDITRRLQVHHILPFHEYPALELVPSNLVTLCRSCHLYWGHLGNWQYWNESVLQDAAYWSSVRRNFRQLQESVTCV